MLRWFQRRASGIARILLLSLATATASQALPDHVDDDHDAAGVPADLGPHDESDHGLRAAGSATAAHPLHCLVCHWARAFRPLATSSAHVAPRLEAGANVHAAVAPPPFVVLAAQLTLRSPPPSPRVA